MPARPRKGKRFGGSAAHHKAMMANLVASLVAAEATEMLELLDRGYTLQKFFPAELSGGAAFLEAIAAPIPEVSFLR